MKKVLALFLVVSLMLCGCSSLIPARTTLPQEEASAQPAADAPVKEEEAPTEEETVEETEAPTEAPTEPAPVYFNPLNGTILDAPYEGRIFGVSVSNLDEALPHIGLMQADIVFECFVNNSIIRTLGLFTDISGVEAVGPIRSDRVMWNDLGLNYDAVIVHASGDKSVLANAEERGLESINADQSAYSGTISFRDEGRTNQGYPYDATLFGMGEGLVNYAEQQGFHTTNPGDKDYLLNFVEDATPADGVDAEQITVTIAAPAWTSGGGIPKKDSTMTYDEELGKYCWSQYGQNMVDGSTGEPEAFKNVIILEATINYFNGMYQTVDYVAGGTGWFACNGKAIPITWGANEPDSPIWMLTESGDPLYLNQGNSYIAITMEGSTITGIGE